MYYIREFSFNTMSKIATDNLPLLLTLDRLARSLYNIFSYKHIGECRFSTPCLLTFTVEYFAYCVKQT